MASLKVAVRVRPFNSRELNMKAQPIIEMEGKKTRIGNHKVAAIKQEGEGVREKWKDFTFDYSYWSFDENDPHFASQEQVFKDLGMDVVGNAFQGYNACVFAYGQTGSGKTHTMMGASSPPESQGLIPRICKDMFNRMFQGKEKGTTYRTEVSYLEIYNERVKDLLKGNQTHSLKVREHPKSGPYVEELSKHLVMDYADIEGVMSRGNSNRTTASTNMNDVSSRSHAIFTMTFVQAHFIGDMPSETVSKIHLVDLAGSERADATGATGQRLKEGAHINKSLVTLGSVISALAEFSQTQRKVFIPYRDSVLTWLLKDSLGGNAKTIMIATISPADCNYGETLSTLRYANRAKNIINKPTINEDSNVKLIRELRAEINKLKQMLGSEVQVESSDVLEELHKKEAKEKSLTEEWTEKWKETQKILMEQKDLALRKAGTGVVLDSLMPHLIGIDDDLLSTGITLYHLKEGETKIGSEDADDKHDITLKGQGLESQHCSIMLEDGVATLLPNNGAVCWVNGQQIDKPTRLFQGCVILLGRTNMFRYNDPAEAEKLRKEGSRSHMNLSRLSFLSRSASDLAWSDNSISAAAGEENTMLEEKRKQLEAEEARLQKESQELINQKALLEEQKNNYQQLQLEKEEAWRAEQLNKSAAIHSAQRELEERRRKLEQEYSAHRKRLAEDWKRLEQQEQDTLSSLQSKEKDLKKRREFLEWETDQEMEQIEAEAQKVENLRTLLENKQEEVENCVNKWTLELHKKIGKSEEELKPLLTADGSLFIQYFNEQAKQIEDWKQNNVEALQEQHNLVIDKMKDLTAKLTTCTDPKLKSALEKQQEEMKTNESNILEELTKVDDEYKNKKEMLKESSDMLTEYRMLYLDKSQECLKLEQDVDRSIQKMVGSEDKISRLESDLALIADQEKLIVSQLAHIDSSKQKLLTIIENSTEGCDPENIDDRKKQLKLDFATDPLGNNERDSFYTACSTTSDNTESNQWNISGSSSKGLPSKEFNIDSSTAATSKATNKISDSPRESSPNHLNKKNDMNSFKSEELSPIKPLSSDFNCEIISPHAAATRNLQLSAEEAAIELKRLVDRINEQKAVVLECLENDCDKEEMNNHMAVLQELRNRYLEIECATDASSRQHWFCCFEDEESTFDFDKGEDSTAANDSELDDSEAHSSVTDHEDQLQLLVEQGVEKRLREIFEQLKTGQKPSLSFGDSATLRRRSYRRSMPSGLNHAHGYGSEDDGSSHSFQGLPRSVSMSSGLWAQLNSGEGIIPGVLDVTIPAFVLRGGGSSTHFQYEICIITSTERWTVLRRYRRFRDLCSHMKKKYGRKVSAIPFPPKKFFQRKSEVVAKERQISLQIYIQGLIKVCSTMPTCPLYNCANLSPQNVKPALLAFSPFFEKGIFESTKYGTS